AGEAPPRAREIGCFIVERGSTGLEIGKDEGKMGLRSSGTVALHFDGCRVPDAQRVGPPGQGYALALEALGAGRVGIAAQALGIAEAAFAEGLRYAGARRAFGQRVVDFQASRIAIADSRTELDAAWLLTLRAARLLDRGSRAAEAGSMAKLDDLLALVPKADSPDKYKVLMVVRDASVFLDYADEAARFAEGPIKQLAASAANNADLKDFAGLGMAYPVFKAQYEGVKGMISQSGVKLDRGMLLADVDGHSYIIYAGD
ncbi:MAG: hypothetical protein KC457_35260, partial [Myxococcales bacterium]|nr:hypothetical protein [Myxococcales bacterium]